MSLDQAFLFEIYATVFDIVIIIHYVNNYFFLFKLFKLMGKSGSKLDISETAMEPQTNDTRKNFTFIIICIRNHKIVSLKITS